MTTDGRPRLTIIVPTLNGAHVVGSTIERLRTGVGPGFDGYNLEIVVVDDGSTDGTAEAAKTAGADIVRSHPRNAGKGAAVRTGLRLSHGRTVVFTDADLSYGPEQVRRVAEAIDAGADVAVGSRAHPDSSGEVHPGRLRRLAGGPFNALTRLVLRHAYQDTQCGLKGFTAAAGARLADQTRIDGFAFDVELLHLAERNGFDVVEVPVEPTQGATSTVRLALHVPQMIRDVLRIRWYESRGRYGPRPPAPEATATP